MTHVLREAQYQHVGGMTTVVEITSFLYYFEYILYVFIKLLLKSTH